MGEPSKVVTGTAEYLCTTRLRNLETETVTKPVSATVAEGEDPAAKLAESARLLEKTIAGCSDVRFLKLLPATPEAPRAEKPKTSLAWDWATAYGEAMEGCQKATNGSIVLCKPMP